MGPHHGSVEGKENPLERQIQHCSSSHRSLKSRHSCSALIDAMPTLASAGPATLHDGKHQQFTYSKVLRILVPLLRS